MIGAETIDQSELIRQIKKLFNNKLSAEVFLLDCVLSRLDATVEKSAEVLIERDYFTTDEIGTLKSLKLVDIKIDKNGTDTDRFRIRKKRTKLTELVRRTRQDSDQSLLFSNRISSNGELRGEVLISHLNEIKESANKTLSLYDALTQLVQDPGIRVKIFCNTPGQSREIVDQLTTIAVGCKAYLQDHLQEQTLPEEIEKAWVDELC